MNATKKTLAAAAALGAILFFLSTGPATATVTDLTNLASDHASIQYQWTFETGAEGGFKDALDGGVGLVNVSKGGAYSATTVAGFDVSTQAMQTVRPTGDRDVGAALRTASNISLPGTGTVEYIFKADTKSEGGYIVATMDGDGDRHYFGYDQTANCPRLGFGNPGHYVDLLGNLTGVTYNAGDWYYVAISYAPSDASHTQFNAYVANLTDTDASTTTTVSGWTPSVTVGGSMLLGIGCYGKDGNHYLDGSVDQVAVYSAALSSTEIGSHLAAIYAAPDLRCDLSYPNYPGVDPRYMLDASSWNNQAVLGTSSANTTNDPTPARYGFDFNSGGTGDQLTLAGNTSLRVANIGSQDYSIEMWLQADEIANNTTLVDARNASTQGWAMWMNGDDGSLSLKFYGSGGSWRMNSDDGLLLTGDDQQHVVVSLDSDGSGGGTATFYVDGQQWGSPIAYSGASSYVDPTGIAYHIGHQAAGLITSLTPFDGEIGAFRLYSSALDSAEVLAHYTDQRRLFQIPEPGSLALIALAGSCLLAVRRRRQR